MSERSHRKFGYPPVCPLVIQDVDKAKLAEVMWIFCLPCVMPAIQENGHGFVSHVPLVVAALVHLEFDWIVASV